MKIYTILFIGIFSISNCFAQSYCTISGFISDKSTGEMLINANLYITSEKQGTISNNYGFFSMNIGCKEPLMLMISFIGYKTKLIHLSLKTDTLLHIYLEQSNELSEITITDKKQKPIEDRNETGLIRLQVAKAKELPQLFGEVDITKALQFMPGIQSGGEGKSDLYVRGGSPDQNLILLDDVPLYYVSHFGGFFSVFNADALSDVKLIKSGFPARYGSRLSSILDIRMKEGNLYEYHGQAMLGLLSSKISIEGPIKKELSSFIISARKNTFPYFKVILQEPIGFNFFDINAKFNYKISPTDRMYLSFYKGDDNIQIKNIEKKGNSISENITKVKWGNTAIAYRWNHIFNSKIFSNLLLSYSKYRTIDSYSNQYKHNGFAQDVRNSLNTNIQDINLKFDIENSFSKNYNVRYGIHSVYHIFAPGKVNSYLNSSLLQSLDTSYNNIKYFALENSLYCENEIAPFDWLSGNFGFRVTNYVTDHNHFLSFEPRIVVNTIVKDWFSFKTSWSLVNQYVHLLSYNSIGMPNDFWMPSTKIAKPEHSSQFTLGIARSLFQQKFEFSIEAYLKNIQGLITFKPGESMYDSSIGWEDKIFTNGNGSSKGIELLLQKHEGKTTGWISFTMAKTDRQFTQLNNNKPFPFKYDRRYNLGLVLIHNFTENINASLAWTYGTGYPTTLPIKKYHADDYFDVFVYTDINSFRMRDYHRLDLGINLKKKLKKFERTWNLSLFNVYNRKNPYYYFYEMEWTTEIDAFDQFVFKQTGHKLRQQSLFSFLPSFGYSIVF